MTTQTKTEHRSFRFRTGNGKWLADEIAHIETMATERLRAGVSYHSVQTGALVLLKMALERTTGELVEVPVNPPRIQACTPATDSPRCAPPKGTTK